MNTRIVHAGFATAEQAHAARERLLRAGFGPDLVSMFTTVSPPEAVVPAPALTATPVITNPTAVGAGDGTPAVHPGDRATPVDDADAKAPHFGAGAAGGAAAGTAVGLGVGLATAPFLGPIAPVAATAVGAYVGSLVGALNGMEGPQDPPPAEAANAGGHPAWPWRVVVATPTPLSQLAAIDLLRELGGADLRDANGEFVAGTWTDYHATEPGVAVDEAYIGRLREQQRQTESA